MASKIWAPSVILRFLRVYFLNVLIALDQLANTICCGDPDETISSRCGKRMHDSKLAYWLCMFLNNFEKDHCIKSVEEDRGSDAAINHLEPY